MNSVIRMHQVSYQFEESEVLITVAGRLLQGLMKITELLYY